MEAVHVYPGGFDRGRPDALLSPRSRAVRTALKIKEGIEFEEWRRLGAQVASLADASAWWIGDWLVYGQRAFPDRYKVATAETGFSYQTLRNYAWVAAQIPVYRRRDTLSFGHHAEVAALLPEEQEMWLLRAHERRWTRNELRRHLRSAGNREFAPTPISIALQVEDDRHERWQAAAYAFGRPLAAWITDVLDDAAEAALRQLPRERPTPRTESAGC